MSIFDIFKQKPGDLGVEMGADAGAPPTASDGEKAVVPKDAAGKRLLFFYGEECPHCHKIMPRLEEVEKDLGVRFERYEVWHNAENAEMLKSYDKGYCGGVPFLYNTGSNDWICGAVETDKIHAFASKG